MAQPLNGSLFSYFIGYNQLFRLGEAVGENKHARVKTVSDFVNLLNPPSDSEWDTWIETGVISHDQAPRLPRFGADMLMPQAYGPHILCAMHSEQRERDLLTQTNHTALLDGDSSTLTLTVYSCYSDVPPTIEWMLRIDRSLRPHPESARKAIKAVRDTLPRDITVLVWFMSMMADHTPADRDRWLSTYGDIFVTLITLYGVLSNSEHSPLDNDHRYAINALESMFGAINLPLTPLAALEQMTHWGRLLWSERAESALQWFIDHPVTDDEDDITSTIRTSLQGLAVMACWDKHPPKTSDSMSNICKYSLPLQLARWRRRLSQLSWNRSDPPTRVHWLLPTDNVPVRIRLAPEPPDIIKGEYGTLEDRTEANKRAASQHRVRAHRLRFRSTVEHKASDRIRSLVARLPLEDRLELLNAPDLPPTGMTVRGLVEGPDGTILRSYVRGQVADQPREVLVLRGLVIARLAFSAASTIDSPGKNS